LAGDDASACSAAGKDAQGGLEADKSAPIRPANSGKKDVDGWDKPGHDEKANHLQVDRTRPKIRNAFSVIL
jgi:hypothetical protein